MQGDVPRVFPLAKHQSLILCYKISAEFFFAFGFSMSGFFPTMAQCSLPVPVATISTHFVMNPLFSVGSLFPPIFSPPFFIGISDFSTPIRFSPFPTVSSACLDTSRLTLQASGPPCLQAVQVIAFLQFVVQYGRTRGPFLVVAQRPPSPLFFDNYFITEVFELRNSHLDRVPHFLFQRKVYAVFFCCNKMCSVIFYFFPVIVSTWGMVICRHSAIEKCSYHLTPDPSRPRAPCGRPPLDPGALAAGVRGLGRPQRCRPGPATSPSLERMGLGE